MCCKSNQISRIHRETLNTESLEPRCRISSKILDHTEKTLFQWGDQFFQISPRIKSLYDWDRKQLFTDRGDINWDRGANFSKFIDRGSHWSASHWGTWTRCLYPLNIYLLLPSSADIGRVC